MHTKCHRNCERTEVLRVVGEWFWITGLAVIGSDQLYLDVDWTVNVGFPVLWCLEDNSKLQQETVKFNLILPIQGSVPACSR